MPAFVSTEISHADLDDALEGQLVRPGDAEWDASRAAWNLAVDQRPDAVVYPADARDVVAVVDYARAQGLAVAAQGTGHGAAAHGSLEGSILANMSRLDGFEIDPDARTVRVEPGALWGPIADAASEHGLAPLAGSARDVGVVGYALGGGVGWLGRRFGLAASSIRAIELLTADGVERRVDPDNEPELFWALRGGGGNFGVVTAMELDLYPVSSVYAGWLLWPVERAADILKLYARWVDTVPNEVSSVGRILHLPPLDDIPEPLRGKSWVVVEAAYVGDEAGAEKLLEPLRAAQPVMDTFAAMPPAGLGFLHGDPPQPVPGIGDGQLVDDLTTEVVDAVVAVAGAGSGTRLISVEARHLGGELAQPRPENGALAALDGKFAVYAVGVPTGREHAQALARDIRAVLDAFAPCSRGRRFLNFKEQAGNARSAFPPSVYRRLQDVKAAYDPDGLLRANHPIEPAS